MPLLKPTRTVIDAPATEVLAESGIIASKPTNGKSKAISDILNSKGMSREEIVEELRQIARFAEKEETRLHANKLALELHGELKKNETSQIPAFTFIIQGADGAQQNMMLNTILTPRET